MAEMLNDLDSPSDAELISRVRGGDLDAYGQLFGRHVEAARRLARQLVRGPDSEDLVSDAFSKVMTALQSGGGPDIAFRAYLLTAVRRLHVDRIRAQSRLTTSDDLTEFDPGVPFQDTVVEQFESGAAARAFASLPERWQMVLWHLEVEHQKPAEIAPLLGMTANSVSALAYRAREGLRQAFLSAHLAEIDDTECRWTAEHLGSYVRKGLSRRDAGKVEAHLEECRSCSAMYLELVEVNNDLSAVLAPLLLGGLAAGYLTATASGVATGGGLIALLDRAKDFVAAHVVPVSAGATVAGVATAVIVVGGPGPGGRMTEPAIDGAAPPSRAGQAAVGGAAGDGPTAQGREKSKRSDRTGAEPGEASAGAVGSAPPTPSAPAEEGAPPAAAPSDTPGDVPTSVPDDRPGTDTAPAPDPGPDRDPDRDPGPAPDPGQAPQPDPDETPGDPPGDDDGEDGDEDEGDEGDEGEETESRDVTLRLGSTVLSRGVGRVRAHVTNLPNGSAPTPLLFRVQFSDGRVHLESMPKSCSPAGGTMVRCAANGSAFHGVFDADLGALAPGENVRLTMTVSVPDVTDPAPGDNTRSLSLTRLGAGPLARR